MSSARESIISGVVFVGGDGISADAVLLGGALVGCLLVVRTRGSNDVALLVTLAPGDNIALFLVWGNAIVRESQD